MIGFSNYVQDITGDFIFNERENSDLYKNQRRFQRVATLDGGVAFEERGLFSADKVISVVIPFDLDFLDKLKEYSKWFVSTNEQSMTMFVAGWDVVDEVIQIDLEAIA